LIPYARKDHKVLPVIFFVLSITCYLLADWVPQQDSLLFYAILFGTFPGPFFLWLVAKSIFDDGFELRKGHLLWFIGLEVAYYFLFFQNTQAILHLSPGFDIVFQFISQLISLAMVILALLEAAKERSQDLVEQRIQFRRTFIYLTAAVVIMTLLAEVALGKSDAPAYLQLFHKGTIAGLVLYFSLINLRFRPNYFFKASKVQPISKLKLHDLEYEKIWDKLSQSLTEEKLYREEGLTIGKLADKIGCKEYKLRRLINRHLGFNNFNDFLNSMRVEEACIILSDPDKADLTILEITYKLGYQSLAPFNKAFKKQTNLTPTGYRNSKLQRPTQ